MKHKKEIIIASSILGVAAIITGIVIYKNKTAATTTTAPIAGVGVAPIPIAPNYSKAAPVYDNPSDVNNTTKVAL